MVFIIRHKPVNTHARTDITSARIASHLKVASIPKVFGFQSRLSKAILDDNADRLRERIGPLGRGGNVIALGLLNAGILKKGLHVALVDTERVSIFSPDGLENNLRKAVPFKHQGCHKVYLGTRLVALLIVPIPETCRRLIDETLKRSRQMHCPIVSDILLSHVFLSFLEEIGWNTKGSEKGFSWRFRIHRALQHVLHTHCQAA
jgi:hypothetical protein